MVKGLIISGRQESERLRNVVTLIFFVMEVAVMKLISPKTALESLLGCAFVAMKLIYFRDLSDLPIIIVVGYVSVRGLYVAFSSVAYEEEEREQRRTKRLYRKLFGRFAYVVWDVPIALSLLAALLALFCPWTDALRAVLITLLTLTSIYAIYFGWYVLSNKRTYIEDKDSENGELCVEEENAWKMVSRVHSIVLVLLIVLGGLYLYFGAPYIYLNNRKLKTAITSLDCDSAVLEDIVPFEWTMVYSFGPYTPKDSMKRIMGAQSPALSESISEGMIDVVFADRGRVVASVCAYPENLGYDLKIAGEKATYPGGGCTYLEYGDQAVFKVTKEDGLVRLYTRVE